MPVFLGIDGGGTKTQALAVDENGRLVGASRAGGANYQACGIKGAQASLRQVAQAALGEKQPDFVCCCLAGADRPRDFAVLNKLLEEIWPGVPVQLENDSMAVLRAGTVDGVGIGLVAGTGSNAVGRRADGRKLQVGGLGRLSGDYGSAWQLGERAVVAAIMARDGRGEATLLEEKICSRLGLEDIRDIIEREFFDWEGPPLNLGELAPLVFEAAAAGDRAALAILDEAGRQIALSARVVLERLFQPQEQVAIVLGGSVFQKGAHPALRQRVEEELSHTGRQLKFVCLQVPPVAGATLFALDAAGLGARLNDAVLKLAAGL